MLKTEKEKKEEVKRGKIHGDKFYINIKDAIMKEHCIDLL